MLKVTATKNQNYVRSLE